MANSLTLASGHKEACNKQPSIWFGSIDWDGGDGGDRLMGKKIEDLRAGNVMQVGRGAAALLLLKDEGL